jgi:hypothetical protein
MLTINFVDTTIVYEFTGRKTDGTIEYYEIDQYDITYTDTDFLYTGNTITVCLNAENAMAPIANVSLTDASVTEEMFKHNVSLDHPGWLRMAVSFDDYSQWVQGAKDSKLDIEAYSGHIIPVKQLLAAGADVHAGDDLALRTAAEWGRVEVVKLLLAAGADIHALDDKALQWATRNGHTEVVKLLLDYSRIHVPYSSTVIQRILNETTNPDIRELLQNY